MDWSHEELWDKAKTYAARAFSCSRDDDDFPFSATICLEFLGRGLLAQVHPALLADPQSGDNVLYACGYDCLNPKSVPAKTVFLRVQTILPQFTKGDFGFVMKQMDRRNAELHSGAWPFHDLPNQQWLPRFYRVAAMLVEKQGYSLEDLLGSKEAEIAAIHMKATEQEVVATVKKRIAAKKLLFDELGDDERKNACEAAARGLAMQRQNAKAIPCPACSEQCLIMGEIVLTSEGILDEDTIHWENVVLPTSLGCVACGLQLKGLDELHAAGEDEQFKTIVAEDVRSFYNREFDPYDYYGEEYMNS